MAPINVRKELQNFVGQVLREGGEDPSLAYRRKGKGKGPKGSKGKGHGKDGKGKGKDRKGKGKTGKNGKNGKGKSLQRGSEGSNYRAPRKLLRKQKRQDKKARRDHFFGHKAETTVVQSQKPQKVSEGKSGKVQKKRKFQDDEEEITSEDEGQEKEEEVEKPGSEPDDAEASSEGGESEEPRASDAEAGSEAEPKAAEGKSSQGGYVPPHLRAKAKDGLQSQQRTLRGILNRVSEGNLDPSSMEIVKVLSDLVPQVGSAKAADAFVEALLSAAVEDPNISVLVLGCFAALVAACHVVFGAAFGAAALLKCLEMLRVKMSSDTDLDEPSNDARIAKNCVIFTMLMFSFGILPGNVVFDVVRFVLRRPITELSAELSLTVLRYGGRQLRSDCPEDFREVLRFVTAEASEARNATTDRPESMETRLDYLLKELNDLKNNKVSFAVMDRFNQTRGWLQTAPLLKGRKVSDHVLSVPFRVLHEETPANWPAPSASSTILARSKTSNQADPLRQAAVAQRLTSELRQNLFVALMGAEDFQDAVERISLAASGAKTGCAEACVVVFHCAIRERKPNAFYAHVAQSLCSQPAPAGKRFSHSMKRAAVQHIQQAHTYGVRAAVCLAELCAAMMISSSVQLPLVVVRFTRFGGDEEGGGAGLQGVLGLLLRHLVESLLQRAVDSQIPSLFAPLRKYNDVREGMLLVLDGQVRPRLPPQAANPVIWENFRLARKEIATAGHSGD
eukprot:Skav204714  [mRNA]  locus=scaffold1549:85841:88039:+ [translate_table: standard]